MHEIMKRIDDAIAIKGITPMDFCRSIGIPPNTYYNWRKTDKVPHVSQLLKIADGLHMSLDDLVRGTNETLKSRDVEVDKKVQILARHLEALPKKDRDLIYDHFTDTLDIYLARVDKKKINEEK